MTIPQIPLDRLRDTWSEVALRLEGLAAAWESGIGEPPSASSWPNPRHVDPDKRRLILIDFVKADLRIPPGSRS